jgi:hypothetical protein
VERNACVVLRVRQPRAVEPAVRLVAWIVLLVIVALLVLVLVTS